MKYYEIDYGYIYKIKEKQLHEKALYIFNR